MAPLSIDAPAGAGDFTVNVDTSAGCAWTASTGVAWLTLGGSGGTGPGSVVVSVSDNMGAQPRTAFVSVADKNVVVNQAGACTFAITPTQANMDHLGGTGSIFLTASAETCDWTASSQVAWITVSPGSGSGSGAVDYVVDPNQGESARAGTIMVAGEIFTLNQTGLACGYEVQPRNASFGYEGGEGQVQVTASPESCEWTAASLVDWILVSTPSGMGSGPVSYTVLANAGSEGRSAVLTVAGVDVTVSQSGIIPCTFTVTPLTASVGVAGGQVTVAVTASADDCAWTATSRTSWLTVTQGQSGLGSDTVILSAAANSGAARSGQAVVAGETVTVNQTGQGPCSFSLNPALASIGPNGGDGTVTVTASRSDCEWTAASEVGWVTILSGAQGAGSGQVVYRVDSNDLGQVRTGAMTVAGQTFTVTQQVQQACTYTLQPTGANMVAEGGDGTVTVTASRPGCAWTAASEVRWVTILSGAQGAGSGQVVYRVDSNDLEQVRTGVITMAGQAFTVTQEASAPQCAFTIDPTELTFEAGGGNGTVQITASHEDCSWAAVSAAEWVRIVEPSSGEGSGRIDFMVEANQGRERRTSLTVGGRIVSIVQGATGSGGSSSGGGCIYDPKAKGQGLGWLLLLLAVAGISVAGRLRVK